jgi:hypothetical protein
MDGLNNFPKILRISVQTPESIYVLIIVVKSTKFQVAA